MKRKTRCSASLISTVISMLFVGHAPAAELHAPKKEKELLQRLANSDAQAAALQQRIEQLEHQVQALRTTLSTIDSPPTARKVPTVALAPVTTLAPQAAASSGKLPSPNNGRPKTPSATGTFVIDEEAAQRALERTLTQAGALLLPHRTFEITPSYTFRRGEQTTSAAATLINTTTGATTPTLVAQKNQQNDHTLRIDIKAGLPYNAQLEFGLPYSNVRTSQISDLGVSTSANGNGVGDATLGIAKTLMQESGWKPDVIGRLAYNFGNGKRQDGSVVLNGGYRQISAEAVALKRQDPLAFVASASYSKVFEKDSIKPGDAVSMSLAALLAASPATSLQLGFSQVYRKKQEINGLPLPGTEQTYGIATLGASSVLSRDITFITQLGIGLGNDAPKYNFTVALPILLR